VIKAYVEKQRKVPTKVVEKPGGDGKVDIGGLWTAPDEDGHGEKLQGGRFEVELTKGRMPAVVAAPGIR
jgi:hypothetical protein